MSLKVLQQDTGNVNEHLFGLHLRSVVALLFAFTHRDTFARMGRWAADEGMTDDRMKEKRRINM